MSLVEKTPLNMVQKNPPMMTSPMISVGSLLVHLRESINETGSLSNRLDSRVSGILGPKQEIPEKSEPCLESLYMNEVLLSMISDLNKINNKIAIDLQRMEEGIGY